MDQLAELLARTGQRDVLLADEGIPQLGKMAGVKSIARNLRTEDDVIRRDYEAAQKLLHGENWKGDASSQSGEVMDIMAARDVHVYQNSPPPSKDQPVAAPPAPAPVTTPIAAPIAAAAAGLSPLAKALITGLSIASGGGAIGTGIYAGLKSMAPAVTNVTNQADPYQLRLIPADEESAATPSK